MRKWFIVTLVAGLSQAVTAQDLSGREVERTYSKVREFMAMERQKAIDEELALTAPEAERFWPIYESYQREIAALQDRYAAMLRDFADGFDDMTEQQARDVIGEYLDIKARIVGIRQDYVPRFLDTISARKLVRLYQMENKIDGVAELPLLLDIPLLEPVPTDAR